LGRIVHAGRGATQAVQQFAHLTLVAARTAIMSDSGKRCSPPGGRRSKNPARERFEVLHDRGEMEFVACAGKSCDTRKFDSL